jgi:hypothetical protein
MVSGGRRFFAEGGDSLWRAAFTCEERLAWGGRRFLAEAGDSLRRAAIACGVCSADVTLQRAASSCERQYLAGHGGGRRPAECRGVRCRPAGSDKTASTAGGLRPL